MNGELERDGFAIARAVLDQAAVLDLAQAIDEHLPQAASAGVRGLAEKAPSVRVLAQSQIVRSLVEPVLGPGARLVRSILFNKSDQANW